MFVLNILISFQCNQKNVYFFWGGVSILSKHSAVRSVLQVLQLGLQLQLFQYMLYN